MTAQAIATSASPFYQEPTVLEGTVYNLAFGYNQREDTWYVSIADAGFVDIVNGVKLICLNPLLRKCADPRRPPGELFVFDSTGSQVPPGLNDLAPGGRCTLVYLTSDWLALLDSGQLGEILAQLQTNTQTGTESTYGSM